MTPGAETWGTQNLLILFYVQKKEPKKKGPAKKILTEVEREAREALRKAKYEEFKAKKAEEKEKRRIRNEELRQKRKDKKVNYISCDLVNLYILYFGRLRYFNPNSMI